MSDATLIRREPGNAEFGDYIQLLKPRVMSLVIFTAAVGMLAAPTSLHPIVAFASILCIAVGAGASGALNMWWDADIDAEMGRTKSRPVPSGAVTAGEALGLGVGLSFLSVMMLGLFANPLAAFLLAFTIFFYAVIYTMWLKRSTPHNIVIGGAAGAFPPMIGWVCATGSISIEAVLLFALIFIWTPPHFWALALFKNEDYKRVKVPMLPVVAGPKATRNQILGYTLLLIPVAIAPAFTQIGGYLYLAVALVLNAIFLKGAIDIFKRQEETAKADHYKVEKRFFGFSILYLFIHFVAVLGEVALHSLMGNYASALQLF